MSKTAKSTQKKYIRRFNTSGICNPISHFYVSRTDEINKALEEIAGFPGEKGGRYYTLFASRQMGKTTFVNEMIEKLDKEKYYPVVISFEGFSDISEEEFYLQFYQEIELRAQDVTSLTDKFKRALDLITFFSGLQQNLKKKFVLIIDEFDGLNQQYIGDLLYIFRKVYFDRGTLFNLHSLILIGVRNITDINMDNASPFNTNDEIPLPLFTKEQVFDLMCQYEEETGQNFDIEVKEQIFYNTQGQPGLTNALCKMLVEDFNPGDKKEIKILDFNQMFSQFLHCHISKNVVNIINKAKTFRNEILAIFNTNEKIEFNVDSDWVGYLYINGAIDYETEKGKDGKINKYIKFANPIYQKKLYNYFKPTLSSERARYFEPGEPLDKYYLNPDELNLFEIIKNYQRYINRRGSQAFRHTISRADGTKLEAAYHYSLDTYLSSVMDSLGGSSSVEFPTGNGKVDIFISFKRKRFVIEIKNYTDEGQVAQAKQQAAGYAKTEGLTEAYLVIFTEVHPRDRLDIHAEEEVEGVTVRSVLVNVNFE